MFKGYIIKISGLNLIWGKVDQMKVNRTSRPHTKPFGSTNFWCNLNLNVNIFKVFPNMEINLM